MAVFSNTATLTYNGNTTVSNTVTGEIVDVLSVAKTAVRGNYNANDTVTYTVSIINSGTATFGDLTLTDNLGSYIYNGTTLVPLTYRPESLKLFVNGVLASNPTVTATAPLTLTGINVPAGGNVIVVYETETNEFAPLETGNTIDNTVTVTGIGVSAPLTATETVTADAAPELAISKSVSPSTVLQNGELTYTFLIQNRGNTAATAVGNPVVSDTFNPTLCNITVTLNGNVLSADTDYTYNSTTGEFATTAGVITVPAATFTRDSVGGAVVINPGTAVVAVKGTVCGRVV